MVGLVGKIISEAWLRWWPSAKLPITSCCKRVTKSEVDADECRTSSRGTFVAFLQMRAIFLASLSFSWPSLSLIRVVGFLGMVHDALNPHMENPFEKGALKFNINSKKCLALWNSDNRVQVEAFHTCICLKFSSLGVEFKEWKWCIWKYTSELEALDECRLMAQKGLKFTKLK